MPRAVVRRMLIPFLFHRLEGSSIKKASSAELLLCGTNFRKDVFAITMNISQLRFNLNPSAPKRTRFYPTKYCLPRRQYPLLVNAWVVRMYLIKNISNGDTLCLSTMLIPLENFRKLAKICEKLKRSYRLNLTRFVWAKFYCRNTLLEFLFIAEFNQ